MKAISQGCSVLFGVLACLLGSQFCTAPSLFAKANVMRPNNLDYLDIETMEYYLQAPKEDYDVAVLFYAQWCNNCHALAPIWDQISRIIHAGSKEANLIMGLFDCEADDDHSKVCNQAGVTHYPTIMFYSLSGQTFHRKQKATKKNPFPMLQHGSKFSGNWQYGDAVYDWIRTMSGLSSWHRAGWGQKLRSMFKSNKVPKKDQDLPLGTPSGGAAMETSSSKSDSPASSTIKIPSSTDDSVTAASTALAEKTLKESEGKIKQLEDVLVRSTSLIDSMLHPITIHESSSARVKSNSSLVSATLTAQDFDSKTYTDAFFFLAETDGWGAITSTDDNALLIQNEDLVLRSCVMEISMDYCDRLGNRVMMDWIDKHGLDLTDEVLANLETDLQDGVEKEEPYCLLVESCIQQDCAAEICRPRNCPFKDTTACRYLTACFETQIQLEYAKALKVETSITKASDEISMTTDAASLPSSDTQQSAGNWGM